MESFNVKDSLKNKEYEFDFKKYVGLLKISLKDCPEIHPNIERSKERLGQSRSLKYFLN